MQLRMKMKQVLEYGMLSALAFVACILSGCASYNSQTSALVSDWEAGNYIGARG